MSFKRRFYARKRLGLKYYSFYFSYEINTHRLIEGVNLRRNGRFTHSKIKVGILLRQAGVYKPFYEFLSRSGFNPGLSLSYVRDLCSHECFTLHLILLIPSLVLLGHIAHVFIRLPSSNVILLLPPSSSHLSTSPFCPLHLTLCLPPLRIPLPL